jgi:amino acid transporter/nucleotide-binding universal stress UspA family protein
MNEGKLVRELGFKEGLAIGLGTMIGAGIFVLPALATERAGQAAAFSYLIAGLICLPVAMIVSELATGMPRAGGSYTFIAQALGPLAGSVVGPANWLGLTFANGFYLIATGRYLALFTPIPPWAGAVAVGLLFTFLNYRGAKLSGSVQHLVVIVLVAILAVFVVVGMLEGPDIPREPFLPGGWGAVVGTVGLIIVSFTGFEKVSTIAEEIKHPGRNLPLAIIGSVAIATILYVLLLFVATGLMPPGRIVNLQKGLLVEAASRTVGPVGEAVMIFAALLATLSSANAATMASSRISYGMGRDRVLPGWFGHAHPKFNTPSNGILFTGGLSTLLALTGSAETLAEISSALFMVSYTLLCISVIVMRRVKRRWYHPAFRAPLYPALPLVAGTLCLGVIVTMDAFSRAAGIGLVALNLLWYVLWVRKRAVVTGEIGPLLERERPLEGVIEAAEAVVQSEKNEVLIPVMDGPDPASLLDLAILLALADQRTGIAILDVEVVPPQIPLEAAQSCLQRRRDTREYAVSQMVVQAAAKGVQVHSFRRAARGLHTGVLAVAESQPGIGLILMGWHGDLSASRIYGSPAKRVLEEARCNVAILRARGQGQIKRVLVPVGGGPHARLGLRLASQIAQGAEGLLTALRVVSPGDELDVEVEEEGLRRVVADVLGEAASGISARIRVHEAVTEAILQEAEEGGFDLLVIGASEEWPIKSILVGALPDVIADRAPCSVLMVRRYELTGISMTRRVISSLRGWR